MTEEQFTDEQGNIVTKKVSVEPLIWEGTGRIGNQNGEGKLSEHPLLTAALMGEAGCGPTPR